jgi:sugar/nucleoside kinase (ribokinase family)
MEEPKTYDVMVAGHLCLDVIPRFLNTGKDRIEELLKPGKLVNVGPATISTGGPVSNTGINLKTLGNRVAFCARLGEDEFGRLAQERLSDAGSAEGIRVVEGAATAYTLVISPVGIDRIFLHCTGANDDFGPEDLDPDLIRECRHFHFGYPPLLRRMYRDGGENLREVFRIAKEAGATTSLDMSLPDIDSESGQVSWPAILEKVLPHVDLFLPSVEETFLMLEPEEYGRVRQTHAAADLVEWFTPEKYRELSSRCLGYGTKAVTLKSGPRGIYLRTAGASQWEKLSRLSVAQRESWSGREVWAPAFAVENFGSATGAGDSSIAGILTGFLRGGTLEESILTGVACGYQNVHVLDAVSGIGDWEKTCQILQAHLPQISPEIKEAGWNVDSQTRLWFGPLDAQSARKGVAE